MSLSGWKLALARQYLQQADAGELQNLMNTFIPLLVKHLSPHERQNLLKGLLNEHLEMLLQGIDEQARAELITQALPTLARVFPLEQVNFLDAFSSHPIP